MKIILFILISTMLQIKLIFELKLNFKMQNEGGTLQNVSIVRQ